MRRREFIAVTGADLACPAATWAQQKPKPVVGFLSAAATTFVADFVPSVRRGLQETGYVEGESSSDSGHAWPFSGSLTQIKAAMTAGV